MFLKGYLNLPCVIQGKGRVIFLLRQDSLIWVALSISCASQIITNRNLASISWFYWQWCLTCQRYLLSKYRKQAYFITEKDVKSVYLVFILLQIDIHINIHFIIQLFIQIHSYYQFKAILSSFYRLWECT